MWKHDFCQGDATSEGDASFYDGASKKVHDGVPRNEMHLPLSFRLPPKLKLPWLARKFASGEEWRAEFGNGTYDKTDGYYNYAMSLMRPCRLPQTLPWLEFATTEEANSPAPPPPACILPPHHPTLEPSRNFRSVNFRSLHFPLSTVALSKHPLSNLPVSKVPLSPVPYAGAPPPPLFSGHQRRPHGRRSTEMVEASEAGAEARAAHALQQ